MRKLLCWPASCLIVNILIRKITLLGVAADYLKATSGFNVEGWDLIKLVTALMIIRNRAETNIADKEVIFLY